jgi:hypothetical protein
MENIKFLNAAAKLKEFLGKEDFAKLQSSDMYMEIIAAMNSFAIDTIQKNIDDKIIKLESE